MTDSTAPRTRLDRASVIQRAEMLVDELGLDAVTMTVLAKTLGTKVSSLYNHVDGLEDLRAEIQIRAMRDLATSLRSRAMGRSGAEGLQDLARSFLEFARAHPHRYAAMTRPILNRERFFAASAEAVEAAAAMVGSTGLSADESLASQMALFSALHGFASLETSGFFGPLVDTSFDYDSIYGQVVEGAVGTIMKHAGTPEA